MLKLYGFLYSPPSRACFTFLKMYEIPFEFKSVNAWEHENETKTFRDMNPLGTFFTFRKTTKIRKPHKIRILRYDSCVERWRSDVSTESSYFEAYCQDEIGEQDVRVRERIDD